MNESIKEALNIKLENPNEMEKLDEENQNKLKKRERIIKIIL